MKCGTECSYWQPPSVFVDENDKIIAGWTAKCLVGFCWQKDNSGKFIREDICIIGDDCYLDEEVES